MRVKLGQEQSSTLTRDACASVTQKLVQAQCGVAFANFLSSADRIQAAMKAKVTKIPLYDIRGGLQTAERAAKLAHQALVGGDLAAKALSLSKAAGRLNARHKGDGALLPEDLPRLRKNIERLNKGFHGLIDAVQKNCRPNLPAPPAPPSVGRRRGR